MSDTNVGSSPGSSFYDERDVAEVYTAHAGPDPRSPNYVMEEPSLLRLIGDVAGLRVLDLGCGDARIGRLLLERGCVSYVGVDSSAKMIEVARQTLRGTRGTARLGTIEAVTAAPGSFDLILSRMALHYVADLDAVIKACATSLSDKGLLVFSVVHPIITSHDARPNTDVQRTNWVVDDYFDRGPRPQRWLGGQVTWYHRTVEDHVLALQRAGLTLAALSEAEPERRRLAEQPTENARRRRIPLFLLCAGRRSNGEPR